MTDCDFPQDRNAAGYLTHAECACPTKDLIDPRYTGTGGMPYDSPEGRAYGRAHTILSAEIGHDKPDTTALYVLASQILWEMEGIVR